MYRTQCVLSLLLLYVGLAHSFDWDIVISMQSGLQFYDVNGTLTHSEKIPSLKILVTALSYDPVHNRVLFADFHNILSFDIASKTIDTLVRNTSFVTALAYDPTSELLFWRERKNLYSISMKPGLNSGVSGKSLIYEGKVKDMTVDICGGFIYWITEDYNIMRARFDGSERETVMDYFESSRFKIDQETQKIYWYTRGFEDDWIKYADLNGMNIGKAKVRRHCSVGSMTHQLAFTKEHLYLRSCDMQTLYCSIRKIPKNAPSNVDVRVDSNIFIKSNNISDNSIWRITAKYNIEDVTRGVPNCDRLKRLLPNNSVSNVSSDESLLCVHGTIVSGESRCECAKGYSGERCEVSVCHNYCLQGECGVSAEGEPKCRCKAGYSGSRCEVNVCQGYCLNDGVCSLNENKEPVCQCTAVYTGARCEVNACQGYCLNAGVCTLNENREPVCQCTTVYTGARCEVNACQGYCRNGGVCALNENREPVCQYPAGYEEGKCDVSMSQIKCIQTCIRNTDVTSATDEGVTWTPTSESTVF